MLPVFVRKNVRVGGRSRPALILVLILSSLTVLVLRARTRPSAEQPQPASSIVHAPAATSIAMVTGATGDFVEQFARQISNKQCYAQRHGYEFIMDVVDWSRVHHHSGYWNRLWFLPKHLLASRQRAVPPAWFFYIDVDAMILNTSIRLEEFTRRVPADADILLHDGGFYINSGAFFVRNTNWSLWFLQQWQRQARQPQTLADQSALWEVLLQLASADNEAEARRTGGAAMSRYRGACRPEVLHRDTPDAHCFTWDTCRCKRCLRRAELCWRREMARLGHPYGRRRLHKVAFWTPYTDAEVGVREQHPRGFNFYASMGHTGNLQRCHPAQLWREGDFVVQDAKGLARHYASWWDVQQCAHPGDGAALRRALDVQRPYYREVWNEAGQLVWPGNVVVQQRQRGVRLADM